MRVYVYVRFFSNSQTYFYFNSRPTEWKPLINAPAIWKYIFNTFIYWKDFSQGRVIKGQLEAIKMKRHPSKQQGNSSGISTNDWQLESNRDAFTSLNHFKKKSKKRLLSL